MKESNSGKITRERPRTVLVEGPRVKSRNGLWRWRREDKINMVFKNKKQNILLPVLASGSGQNAGQ